MKRLLAMALLLLALVWFDAAFMEQGALVWQLPQPRGGVYALTWVNNTDCLLLASNQVDPDEQGRYQNVYDFYLQSGSQPPQLVGSLPAGGHILHCEVRPMREGVMLDVHRRENELWFYDERSQTLQRWFDDADRPEPSGLLREYDYFEEYWLGPGRYLINRGLEDGTASHNQTCHLSLYDSRTGQEQPLLEVQSPWDASHFVPGAYLGPQAGRSRWLALNYLGKLLEITLPEGDWPAEARFWQAAEEWPLPEQDRNRWYWHFWPVQGRPGDCWLLEAVLPGRQSKVYQVVDLQTGELQGGWQHNITEDVYMQVLDVYGSRIYVAQSPALGSLWGNKIWEYDYQTGERQLIWQDNLTRWRNLVFDRYGTPDYIGGGLVSPDGRELLFWSAQDYVRRLSLAE